MPATITIDRGDCESVDGKKEWSGKSMAQFEDAFVRNLLRGVHRPGALAVRGRRAVLALLLPALRLLRPPARLVGVVVPNVPRADEGRGHLRAGVEARAGPDLNDVVADIFPAAKAAARAEAHALALSKYEEANISETMLHLVRLPCPRLQPLISAPLTPAPPAAQLGKWKVVQGQVIHLCLSTRSPAHLRMFSQALTTVERRVGLVLGDVAAPGVRGRFATLVGVGFEPLSPAAAETRVRVWALQSRATEVIKLRVRVGAPFTILHVASHPAAVHNVAPRNPPPGSYIQRDDGSGGWDFAVASVFGEAPAPAEPRPPAPTTPPTTPRGRPSCRSARCASRPTRRRRPPSAGRRIPRCAGRSATRACAARSASPRGSSSASSTRRRRPPATATTRRRRCRRRRDAALFLSPPSVYPHHARPYAPSSETRAERRPRDPSEAQKCTVLCQVLPDV